MSNSQDATSLIYVKETAHRHLKKISHPCALILFSYEMQLSLLEFF